jgi:hypothetical protein
MQGESPLNMMRPRGRPVRAHPAAAAPRRRRRLWPAVVSVAVVIALAAGWSWLWYYAASVADRTLSGWVEREAAAGRVYSCGSQGIGGFPFRIQVRCVEAGAAINSNQPPFALNAKDITFTAEVYHPTLLVAEIIGPLTVAVPGQPPSFTANWSRARMSVSGRPPEPDSVAVTLDNPRLDHAVDAVDTTAFEAGHAEVHSRIVGGSAGNNPVIETIVQFTAATAPTLHPLLAAPLQGDIDTVLRGLKDLAPKPWADRFRELQASGGSIEIKQFRIERTDAIVVGTGSLTVNQNGKLDGLIRVAIVGIDTIVPLLGIDRLIGHGIDRLTAQNGEPPQGLNALDRLVPGLSGVVRDSANASLIDNLKKMGQPTDIDKKPAIVLPLRFSDGSVYLGMLRLGEVPALF